MEADHRGSRSWVDRDYLLPMALYAYGFNYLQCQCAYDSGPGQDLVSMYHLIKLSDNADRPEEVRVKYSYRGKTLECLRFTGYGKQQTGKSESYDMIGIVYEGHPNLKRILMPEDWVGLYVGLHLPDFYELQDAY